MKMQVNLSSTPSLTAAPLVEVLQQCNQNGESPSTNYQAWTECLQDVFASRNYVDTANSFVSAINQVWGPAVTSTIMLSAVTGLTDFNNQQAFTTAVVQPLITALLSTFLIRDNLSDTGGQSSSPFWISPDIICYQQNTLTVATAVSDYGTDLNEPFTNGEANNFYIRAVNISTNSATGYVSLYAVPVSLLLTPQSWQLAEISTPASTENFYDSSNSATIAPNEICLTTTPFTYQGVPGGGHFCMIAIASGANGMPFPIPASFSSNAAQALWVETNPSVSQRNLSFQAFTGSQATLVVSLGNNNSTAGSFIVTVTQSGAGSYPSGTTIAATITDSRAPFNTTQNWSSGGVSFLIGIPANINGSSGNSLISLSITITLPTTSSFSGTAPVSIGYYQVPSQSFDAEEQLVIRGHKIPSVTKLATTEISQLILLGTCNFIPG
jgi:hypothetical protein